MRNGLSQMVRTMFGRRRWRSAHIALFAAAVVWTAAANVAAVAEQLDQPPALSVAPTGAQAPAGSSTAEGQPAAPPLSGPTAPSALAAAAAAGPTIAEPVNDMVRVLNTVQALDKPDKDGKPLGRIRAGVKIKAIGVITGGRWVQIELPNQSIAYVPLDALGIGANAPGAASTSEGAKVSGPVTAVPDAATLVLGDRAIKLAGIDPGPPSALGGFETWVHGRGPLECEPFAQTGRYRCFTNTGVDVAEAAILNGAGRVGDGATPGYREAETAARQAHRGLWQGP